MPDFSTRMFECSNRRSAGSQCPSESCQKSGLQLFNSKRVSESRKGKERWGFLSIRTAPLSPAETSGSSTFFEKCSRTGLRFGQGVCGSMYWWGGALLGPIEKGSPQSYAVGTRGEILAYQARMNSVFESNNGHVPSCCFERLSGALLRLFPVYNQYAVTPRCLQDARRSQSRWSNRLSQSP